jgi:hypothetical protein
MLTVRFPDGTTVEYNTAHYLIRDSNGWVLYTAKDGDWVAWISAASGCIIEATRPCRIYNAMHTTEQLRLLIQELRRMNYSDLSIAVTLKRELAKFNSRTRTWKE